jgi:hypothetical protein
MASRTKIAGYFWVKVCIAFGLILGLLLLGQTVRTYRYVSLSLVRQEAQTEADRSATALGRLSRDKARDTATLTPFIDELIRQSPEKIAWMRVLNTDGKVIASGGDLRAAPAWTAATLRVEMTPAPGGRGPKQDVRTTPSGEVLLGINRFPGGRGGRGGPPNDQGRGDQGRGVTPSPADANRDQPAPPFMVMPDQQAQPRPGFPDGGRAGGFSGAQGRGGGGGGRGPGGPYVETAIYLNGVSVSLSPLLAQLGVGCTAAFALLAAVIIIGLRFPSYMSGRQYEEELALARRVQRDLFPREDLQATNLEFAARFIPSRQVGGDLYDIFQTDDGGVAMVLGDVSGKGLSAALLMGVVQGAVRTSSDSGLSASHEYAASRLNHLMCMKTGRERFVSLFWGYLNPEGTKLSYINAGHLPPILVRERFGHADAWRLEQGGGPVMGVIPGATYRQAEVDVKPGDLLVVFSDGVSEATNAQGAEFGEDGIVESVKRAWQKPAGGVCDSVLADVRQFLGDELPHDDQTLMVVRLERVADPNGIAPVEVDSELIAE